MSPYTPDVRFAALATIILVSQVADAKMHVTPQGEVCVSDLLPGPLARASGEAVDEWRERAGVPIVARDGACKGTDAIWMMPLAKERIAEKVGNPNAIGYTERGAPTVIFLAPETPADYVGELALHELGHALGLEHTPCGAGTPAVSVMCKDLAGGTKHLTDYDVGLMRRVTR